MLDPKTLENIQATAVKANSQRFFSTDREPPHVYYKQEGDTIEKVIAEEKPNDHQCGTLESLCEWVKNNHELDTGTEVWIGDSSVVVQQGRHRATFPFQLSDQFLTIIGWGELENATAEVAQAELYQLLRTKFRGCIPDQNNLASLVGKVDIKKFQEANGAVTTGKVSMAKSMVAEASGAGQLPDLISFKIPLFNTAPLECDARIHAAFDLEPNDEVFRLAILPGQIGDAEYKARKYLFDLVKAGLKATPYVPVYFGDPSRP